MTAMGRAAVATSADQPIELREYPVPTPAGDEILVRTTVAGLCGSDLHICGVRCRRSSPIRVCPATRAPGAWWRSAKSGSTIRLAVRWPSATG